ncbi:1-(5-phosphoribosyl)-5-[(5-phosphoribosylamino)methylideneamino]imidazole-4-carboxamide isomerase [Candidatus Magnetaquicoccus inordinatus]|uniref:1-(5-phosphoribosyl)-5-[(5- phosphoribosylamino)methylideneamino]imidazole-4- carboxamide isomerase n=1 Tax=Candidatus Magnetaquicoccus inordinatus TaxID=2496818 RepID=UPI00102C4E96|nr:1-(5-phosphoribosyl)-5-[(5-phosphoribosylamino)methylideneamino]imidazole-4-carboxamide isomerase [Candidatus Magnetaquicoccus inordinatus]
MLIIPAIDLKDGQCVRLFQGDMNQHTVYSDDPGAMARHWQDAGAQRLHVVDLNGAFAGQPVNDNAIAAILKALSIPVQLGGGIRTLATMEHYLNLGIQRVILGTIACRDPQLVQEACRLFPGQILVGIDARDGWVAVQGWAEVTNIRAVELAQRFMEVGVAEIIFTDIARDGALQGPNIVATRALAEAVTTPIILSGGISSLADVQKVMENPGPYANGGRISGIITGKALYDGRLDFAAAVAACQLAA